MDCRMSHVAGRRVKAVLLVFLIISQATTLFAEDLRIGTTFSPVQCKYLDLDWKKVYLAVLGTDYNMIRLGAYWKDIEKEEDVYDFSDLDWQTEKAKEKGMPIVLTVGMKAPRWPEYFIPAWVLKKSTLYFGADVSKNAYLRERTLKFIEKVVTRYGGNDIIQYWQVENEPLNRIGIKYWYIGKAFLRQEVELVRRLDPAKRPIILTVATYPNGILRFVDKVTVWHDPIKECLKMCDILGVNVYPIIGARFGDTERYFWTDSKGRDKYFSEIIGRIKRGGKPVWVTELQAEPWEPGQLVYTLNAMPPTGWPEMTVEYFNELRSLGVETFLLWGCEYWYFREQKYGYKRWPKAVRILLKGKRGDGTE